MFTDQSLFDWCSLWFNHRLRRKALPVLRRAELCCATNLQLPDKCCTCSSTHLTSCGRSLAACLTLGNCGSGLGQNCECIGCEALSSFIVNIAMCNVRATRVRAGRLSRTRRSLQLTSKLDRIQILSSSLQILRKSDWVHVGSKGRTSIGSQLYWAAAVTCKSLTGLKLCILQEVRYPPARCCDVALWLTEQAWQSR